MQVIGRLPENPVVLREFSTANLGNATTDPAVSDDGGRVLFAGDALWMFDGETGMAQLPMSSRVTAICFRSGTQEALVASERGELHRIHPSGAVSMFAHGELRSTAMPVAVQLSTDGTRGYLASEDGLLAVIEAKTGDTKYINCHCKPSGFRTLNTSAIFAINDSSPLLLFDVSRPDPRLWFVPLDRIATEMPGSRQ
jgi:hypothetical protein